MEKMDKNVLKFVTELSSEQRIDLCHAAKTFAGNALDLPSPITIKPLIMSYAHFGPVIQCETIPIAYLEFRRVKPEHNEWIIWINTNELAKEYNYEVEMQIAEPTPIPKSKSSDPFPSS